MRKVKPATCPFCGRLVDPPTNLGFQFADFDAGFCECGAVYVSDVTGHNQGAAFMEALILACGGNWELAWELTPEEDYQEFILEHYDQRSHQIIQETGEPSPYRGVLYFLRLADDLRGLSAEKIAKLKAERRKKEEGPPPGFTPRRLRRPEAERLLREGKTEELLLHGQHEPLNLRTYQKLLYHADPLLRWKAVLLLGEVASRLVKSRPDLIADLVKRLIYASADSAASAWGALETVGEIIRHHPERFGLFVKNLFAFLKYPEYRPAALWALGRIGEREPGLIRREPALLLLRFLEDKDANTRAAAVYACGLIGLKEALPKLEDLLSDQAAVEFFDPEEETLKTTTVGALASEAISKLG